MMVGRAIVDKWITTAADFGSDPSPRGRAEAEAEAWEGVSAEYLPELAGRLEPLTAQLFELVADDAEKIEMICRLRGQLANIVYFLQGAAPQDCAEWAEDWVRSLQSRLRAWDDEFRVEQTHWWRRWLASGRPAPEDLVVRGPAPWWLEIFGEDLFAREAAVLGLAAAAAPGDQEFRFEGGWILVWGAQSRRVQVYHEKDRGAQAARLEWWDPVDRTKKELALSPVANIFEADCPAGQRPVVWALRVDSELVLPWPERWRDVG